MGVWDWHVHSAVFETDKQKGDATKKKKPQSWIWFSKSRELTIV